MKIHLYTLSWNEEVIMPYFLRYYSNFCNKIVVFDNESTDRTPEIVRSFPNTELRTWSSNGQLNDYFHLNIKHQCYKESRGLADWVIVCDSDEFVFHPNLLAQLEAFKAAGVTLPKTKGYDMIPNCTIDPDANLPYVYHQGTRATAFDKRIIFDPKVDITFDVGCHNVVSCARGTESEDFLYMLHYKKLNLDYYKERHRILGTRLSETNRSCGLGFHYLWTPETMENEYNQVLSNSVQVL